jgi:hypothetical protein
MRRVAVLMDEESVQGIRAIPIAFQFWIARLI